MKINFIEKKSLISKKHFIQRVEILQSLNYLHSHKAITHLNDLLTLIFERNVNLVISYLCILGTYPTPDEIEELAFLQNSTNGKKYIRNYFDERLKLQKISKNRISLINPSNSYVDITYTSSLNFTTGIQRVVRELVRHKPINVLQGKWNNHEAIFETFELSKGNKKPKGNIDFAKKNVGLENIILLGKDVLIPDTTGFNNRVQSYYCTLSDHTNITSIIYDDIPLQRPQLTDEYTRNGFPLYFKNALKYSTTILAISHVQLSNILSWNKYFDSKPETKFKLLKLSNFCNCTLVKRNKKIVPRLRKILIVGSFDLRKNSASILPLIANLSNKVNMEITLIGAGGNFHSELKGILKNGNNIKFSFIKNASDKVLHQHYLKADFSVFLSSAEGFGLPVIESLHHGTPVVTSSEPSVIENAGNLGTINLDLTNLDEARIKFAKLCLDDDYLSFKQKECSTNPNLNFTWEMSAKGVWRT